MHALMGGHTIRSPEPIYGLAVTGMVSPHRMLTNANARPGDTLVLTKPLGTGIITTGIKRRLDQASLERKAIAVMTKSQHGRAGTRRDRPGQSCGRRDWVWLARPSWLRCVAPAAWALKSPLTQCP